MKPGHRASLRRTPNDEAGRSIAVTGANSFIGRNLVGLLEEDTSVRRVVTLDVGEPSTSGGKTRSYETDLTEPSIDARISEILQAEGVDTVVHLAFLSAPSHATAWAHELESVGTMHLLNACRQRPVSNFILSSQTIVYGPHPSNPNFLTESHSLRGIPNSTYVGDKIDAERETAKYAREYPDRAVSILRLAPVLGPTISNYVTRWLSRTLVPTMMGFDPLVQFLHELDAVVAFKLAVDSGVAGVFNIVGDGVLPISTVVRLAGRVRVPVPRTLARPASSLLWATRLSGGAPPELLELLRHLCVADGQRARQRLGFRAAFTSREAVLDFSDALRLREARLLQEAR